MTIPKRIRERLGLEEGERISFTIEDGTARIRPVNEPMDQLRAVQERLAPLDVDELRRESAERWSEFDG